MGLFSAANLFTAAKVATAGVVLAGAYKSYRSSNEAAKVAEMAGAEQARAKREEADEIKRGNLARWVANGYAYDPNGSNGTLDDLDAQTDTALSRDLRIIDFNTQSQTSAYKADGIAALAGGFANSVALGSELF